MASVWKRLQRVNKRAAKFQYTAVYHRIDLETTPKWKPNKLSVVWTRRSRRVLSDPQEWEPSLKDPLRGAVQFTVPENQTVAVTLFKDSRTNELEDKDWTFVLEDVSPTGKRRRLATSQINMRRYATLEPSQRILSLHFDPCTNKIVAASMQFTLHCVLLREGQATDEDMQSLASLLSVNNNSDIAVLEDLDEDDYNNTLSDHSTRQVFDLRQQMEEMTHSLTASDLACTPNSVQSLNFDSSRTPTGPASPASDAALTPMGIGSPTDADGTTHHLFKDLKITEEKDKHEKPKSRPEFLSSLTKLAMKEPSKFSAAPKAAVGVVPTNNEIGIKGITFKTSTVVKSDNRNDSTDVDDTNNNKEEISVNEESSVKEDTISVKEDTISVKQELISAKEELISVKEEISVKEGSSTKEDSSLKEEDSENLKPLELKTNLNSISLDKNDNEEEDADRTPTADDRLAPALQRDKTPVQDLLEWCQSVTGEYKSCKVTNLTTSFRSGLSFCAIIHRYRPDLIDFSGLQPDDAERNVRTALEASAKLGISQVLTAADVCSRPTPDRLAIMTYLFQLRAHFTGNELQVEQLGSDEAESSYLVGRHDTDGSLPPELFSREVSTRRSRHLEGKPRPLSQSSQESRNSQERSTPEKVMSPLALKEPRDSFLHQSKTVLNKFLSSPTGRNQPTTKWFTNPIKVPETPPPKPERLMTRKELTDPFGSDEEDEQPPVASPVAPGSHAGINGPDTAKPEQEPVQTPQLDPLGVLQPPQPDNQSNQDSNQQPLPPEKPKPITPDLPKPTPQLLSRHDELKERARLLLEQTKKEAREKVRKQKEKEDSIKTEAMNGVKNGELSPSKKPVTEEERQAILRERARKLIADARAGVISPTSPLSPNRARGGTVEIISERAVMEEIAAAGGLEQMDALLGRTDSVHSNTPPRSEDQNSEETRSVKSVSAEGEDKRTEEGDSPNRRTPLQSFSAIIERLTPDKENVDQGQVEVGSYIVCELEALEREQRAVDEKAAALEKQLRRVMQASDDTQNKWLRMLSCVQPPHAEEDRLMSQWFNLVNKKNALLRRQMQLNILEQEEDLSRRCELLARELRLSLGVEEWRKTPGQRRRERLLLQELLSAVNERDRLVQEMDEQEKAIAEDAEIEHNLSQVEIQRKNNCILQ